MASGNNIDTGKLFCGPPMSPAIFSDKWVTKFRAFLNVTFRELSPEAERVKWVCDFCEHCFELGDRCVKEAKELGLRREDFSGDPPQPAQAPEEIVPEEVLKMMVNPFTGVESVVLLADGYVQRLAEMKRGQSTRGLRWQDLPLIERRRMNELLLKVEEAKQQGWWEVDDRSRKDTKDKIRKREQAGPWLTV